LHGVAVASAALLATGCGDSQRTRRADQHETNAACTSVLTWKKEPSGGVHARSVLTIGWGQNPAPTSSSLLERTTASRGTRAGLLPPAREDKSTRREDEPRRPRFVAPAGRAAPACLARAVLAQPLVGASSEQPTVAECHRCHSRPTRFGAAYPPTDRGKRTAVSRRKQTWARRNRFRRNGAVRARCLAWLLQRRTDSHTWRAEWTGGPSADQRSGPSSRRQPRPAIGWTPLVVWIAKKRSRRPQRSISWTANRKRASVCQRRLMPKRSGAAEGVGDARRPAPVQIDHSGRRGPVSGL